MAALNVSHDDRESGVKDEDEDIAVAIAASLDTPQGVPCSHIQRSSWWSPKTDEDWSTYFRQRSAEEEAAKYSM